MGDDPADRSGDLSFQKAEFTEGAPAQPAECAVCKQPLVGAYYLVGGNPTCERCKTQHEFDQASVSSSGRFLRAAVFGVGAAAAGSGLWYAVRVLSGGYEVGLIAILVGLMVGGAVRAGSRRRGGPLYQAMAVVLTYVGICAQYVPDIVEAIRKSPPPAEASAPAAPAGSPAPASPPATTAAGAPSVGNLLLALGLLLAFALAAPFLGGLQSIIGILIIGFALWEAWKMNRRVPIEIEGPFRLGTDSR